MLYEALIKFPEKMAKLMKSKYDGHASKYSKRWHASEEQERDAEFDNEVAWLEKGGEFDLGPLDSENFFFYLVLDNVKSLFKIER